MRQVIFVAFWKKFSWCWCVQTALPPSARPSQSKSCWPHLCHRSLLHLRRSNGIGKEQNLFEQASSYKFFLHGAWPACDSASQVFNPGSWPRPNVFVNRLRPHVFVGATKHVCQKWHELSEHRSGFFYVSCVLNILMFLQTSSRTPCASQLRAIFANVCSSFCLSTFFTIMLQGVLGATCNLNQHMRDGSRCNPFLFRKFRAISWRTCYVLGPNVFVNRPRPHVFVNHLQD